MEVLDFQELELQIAVDLVVELDILTAVVYLVEQELRIKDIMVDHTQTELMLVVEAVQDKLDQIQQGEMG